MRGKISPLFWVGLGIVGVVIFWVLANDEATSKYVRGGISGATTIAIALELQRQAQNRQKSENEGPASNDEPSSDLEPAPLPPLPPSPLTPMEMAAIPDPDPEFELLDVRDFER